MVDVPNPGQAFASNLTFAAQSLLNRAGAHRGQYEESLMVLASALHEANGRAPAPIVQAIEEALQKADAGQWAAAEKLLLDWVAREALTASERCQVLMYLRDLYIATSRNADALDAARSATAAARQIDSEMLLAMQLRVEARCERAIQQFDDALARVDEAFALLPEEPMYELIRSQLHLERAACYCAQQRFECAEECLARTEFAAVLSIDLPGWRAAASWYQQLRAGIHASRGRLDEAAAGWRTSVELQRRLSEIPYLQQCFRRSELAHSLAGLAAAEAAAGRPRAARAAQRECDVLRRKSRLPNTRTGAFSAVAAFARKLLAGCGPKSACSKSPSI